MSVAAQSDPTHMYSWTVTGHADRRAGGVTGARDRAVAELVDALNADAGTEGEVKMCWLGTGIEYEYGDVVVRAKVEPGTGAVVWGES